MKKALIVFIVVLATVVSCSGYDKVACMEEVQAAFPDSEVRIAPGKIFKYIVRNRDGSIVYVETMGIYSTKLTTKAEVFGPLRVEDPPDFMCN